MNSPVNDPVLILRLPTLSVLDLVGKDAAAILHNLTTNEVKSLTANGPGVETFITNVKGKCIGHVLVFRTDTGFRLIGAAGQSETIASQMGRYTIREEAEPQIIDESVQPYLIVGRLTCEPLAFEQLGDAGANLPSHNLPSYHVPWVDTAEGERGLLVLCPTTDGPTIDELVACLRASEILDIAEPVECIDGDAAVETFHALRVTAGYPWYAADFDDSHLPQEVNRETETISFTKGCYLGQETIARLDALGQVQKKLVLWSIDDFADEPLPEVDTKLFAGGEKPVGRLTSVARERPMRGASARVLALGFARRSHFEVGSEATGAIAEKSFVAKVERA